MLSTDGGLSAISEVISPEIIPNDDANAEGKLQRRQGQIQRSITYQGEIAESLKELGMISGDIQNMN